MLIPSEYTNLFNTSFLQLKVLVALVSHDLKLVLPWGQQVADMYSKISCFPGLFYLWNLPFLSCGLREVLP